MKIVRADGFAARLRGWLGRRAPDPDEGLWLVPCSAVHTVGMRFPIDLVFLDRAGRVLRIDHRVSPWRLRWHRSAHSVLELCAGTAKAWALTPGQLVKQTRGEAWLAVQSGLPLWVPCVATGMLLCFATPAPVRAAAPLLEDPPALVLDFKTEWPTDEERDPVEAGVASAARSRDATAKRSEFVQYPSSQEAGRVESVRVTLPPIRLTRPLAVETLDRLLDEADSLYRGRQWARAMEAYRGLIELDPHNRTAWLRVGNLHHQRNQLASAAGAYRRAAQAHDTANPDTPADDVALRAKALANLVSVNLEIARDTLAQLQSIPVPAESATAELRERAGAELRELELAARRASAAGQVRGASGSNPPRDTPGASQPREVPGQRASDRRVSVEYLRDPPVPQTPVAPASARERPWSAR